MGRFKIRYMVRRLRKGRYLYFWIPKPRDKEGGFMCTSLGDNEEAAKSKAIELNKELAAWRKGIIKNHYEENTFGWLCNRYELSPEYKRLAERTQETYSAQINRLKDWAGFLPYDKITRAMARELYENLLDKPRTAKYVISVARTIYSFARNIGVAKENPFEKMRIPSNEPRSLVWWPEEIQAFKATAEAYGRPSMSLAITLALEIGQRQGDLLSLARNQYVDGSITLRQSKTKTNVRIPCSIELRNMIALYSGRTHLIQNEETGERYKPDNFKHYFKKISRRAGVRNELQFLDLRRTCVVRLAEAGCTVPEIAAISGHSIDSCQRIMEVYLPRNVTMAQNAIGKLEQLKLVKVETKNDPRSKKVETRG